LDVNGDINLYGALRIDRFNLLTVDDQGTTIRYPAESNSPFRIQTDFEVDKVVVNSAGNVGIGTPEPQAKLHVQGDEGGAAGIYLNDAAPASDKTAFTLYNSGGSLYWSGTDFSAGVSKWTAAEYNDNIYRSTGSVGIGTTNPTGKLQVTTSEGAAPSIFVSTTEGNVGIGTTDPNYKLDVNGDINLYGALKIDRFNLLTVDDQGTTIRYPAESNSPFRIQTDLGVDKVVVNPAGNVGIGTTDPQAKLHVEGDLKFAPDAAGKLARIYRDGEFSLAFVATNEDYGGEYGLRLNVGENSSGRSGLSLTSPLGSLYLGSNDRSPWGYSYTCGIDVLNSFAIRAGGADRLFIDAISGNIRIGGAGTPESMLAVAENVSVGGDYVDSPAPSNGVIIEGSVGIGTPEPQAKLHVEGADGGAAGIYLNAAAPSNTESTLYNSGGKLYWSGTNFSDGFSKWTAGTGDNIYRLNGSVGIGTTEPQATLEVNGTLWNADGVHLAMTTGSNVVIGNVPVDPISKLRVDGTVEIENGAFAAAPGTHLHPSYRFVSAEGVSYSNIGMFRDEEELGFSTCGTEEMRISSNDGDVGIGTSTPGAKLEVVGGPIKATGGLIIQEAAGMSKVTGRIWILSLTTPTITTTAISAVTQTTAASGGNVISDGDVTVTSRGVCWNTTGSPTVADSHTTNGAGEGSFTSSLTGLTIVTTYYVRAYAINSIGTAYGNEVNFITLPHAIGELYGGGTVFYVDAAGLNGLIVAPKDYQEIKEWWNGDYTTTGAVNDYIGAGSLNTQLIISNQGEGDYAAKFCADCRAGGFADWYLPSLTELRLLCAANKAGLVPGAFKLGGDHWTSTEHSTNEMLAHFIWISADYVELLHSKESAIWTTPIRGFGTLATPMCRCPHNDNECGGVDPDIPSCSQDLAYPCDQERQCMGDCSHLGGCDGTIFNCNIPTPAQPGWPSDQDIQCTTCGGEYCE
jgi:hypothetical protein